MTGMLGRFMMYPTKTTHIWLTGCQTYTSGEDQQVISMAGLMEQTGREEVGMVPTRLPFPHSTNIGREPSLQMKGKLPGPALNLYQQPDTPQK